METRRPTVILVEASEEEWMDFQLLMMRAPESIRGFILARAGPDSGRRYELEAMSDEQLMILYQKEFPDQAMAGRTHVMRRLYGLRAR